MTRLEAPTPARTRFELVVVEVIMVVVLAMMIAAVPNTAVISSTA
jgi:hypothetical protein